MRFLSQSRRLNSLPLQRDPATMTEEEEQKYFVDRKHRFREHIESTIIQDIEKVPTAMDYKSDESDIFENRSRYDMECRSDMESQDDEPTDRYSEGGRQHSTHDNDIDSVVAEWKSNDEFDVENGDWEDDVQDNNIEGQFVSPIGKIRSITDESDSDSSNKNMGSFANNMHPSFDSLAAQTSLGASFDHDGTSKMYNDVSRNFEEESFIRKTAQQYGEINRAEPSSITKAEMIKLIVENENRKRNYNSRRVKDKKPASTRVKVLSTRENKIPFKRQELQLSTIKCDMVEETVENTNHKQNYNSINVQENKTASSRTEVWSNNDKIPSKRQSLPSTSFRLFKRNPSRVKSSPSKLQKVRGLYEGEETKRFKSALPEEYKNHQAPGKVRVPQNSSKALHENIQQNQNGSIPVCEVRVPQRISMTQGSTQLSHSNIIREDPERTTDQGKILRDSDDENWIWKKGNKGWIYRYSDNNEVDSRKIGKEKEEDESLSFSSENSTKFTLEKSWEAISEAISEPDINEREDTTTEHISLRKDKYAENTAKTSANDVKAQDGFFASIHQYNCFLGGGSQDAGTDCFDCFESPRELKKERNDMHSENSGVSLLEVGSMTLDSSKKSRQYPVERTIQKTNEQVPIEKVEFPVRKVDCQTWSTESTPSSAVSPPRIRRKNVDLSNTLELGIKEMQNELHEYKKPRSCLHRMQGMMQRKKRHK